MSRATVVSLCDYTGVMVAPWLESGYSAVLVDPRHGAGVKVDGAVTRVGHVIDHPATWECLRGLSHVAFVSAFPPCTDLASSGARWFARKAQANPSFQLHAMRVVWQCYDVAQLMGAPWLIENPVGRVSSLWRKPDHTFHPWHFAGLAPDEHYSKLTCLWTGGGFRMPARRPLDTEARPDNRILACTPGPERGEHPQHDAKGIRPRSVHGKRGNE